MWHFIYLKKINSCYRSFEKKFPHRTQTLRLILSENVKHNIFFWFSLNFRIFLYEYCISCVITFLYQFGPKYSTFKASTRSFFIWFYWDKYLSQEQICNNKKILTVYWHSEFRPWFYIQWKFLLWGSHWINVELKLHNGQLFFLRLEIFLTSKILDFIT